MKTLHNFLLGTNMCVFACVCVTEKGLRIVVPIDDIDTQEKKTVAFTCKVNIPSAKVQWMKGGQEVTLSKRIVYRVDKEKHTLTIKDCTLADEGEYTVVAGADKATAELIISEAPTDFTAQLKDQTVTEFEDAEFLCTLTKEKADVKWYRNGREIREGPRYVTMGFTIYTAISHKCMSRIGNLQMILLMFG